MMEESMKKVHVEGGDREILYSKAIKAGKRIYYLDVKKNLKDDLFIAITESKKVLAKEENAQTVFEKHKIFLYKEDFGKFMEAMNDVIAYIDKRKLSVNNANEESGNPSDHNQEETASGEIKLDINF